MSSLPLSRTEHELNRRANLVPPRFRSVRRVFAPVLRAGESPAKTRIAAQVVQVIVPPESPVRVKTRVERLEEPAERLVLPVQARVGACEVVHRRRLAIPHLQSAAESRDGLPGA